MGVELLCHSPSRAVSRVPSRNPAEGVGGSLSSLFANGEDGFLFYPMSDLTRLFTTTTGAVNVAANDDPVGLDLDSRTWGGKTLAQVVSEATERVVNGDFATDTVWTKGAGWAIAAGKATYTPGNGSTNLTQGSILATGLTHVVTFTVSGRTAGVVQPFFGSTGLGAISANGTYTVYGIAQSGSLTFQSNTTFDGSIDNVSCKLVPGNHGVQATTTKRPLWKSNSGKPNLTYDGTDDFLATPHIPGAAGTAAVAFKSSAFSVTALGGGTGTGDKRLRLGLADVTGRPRVVFNTATDQLLGPSDKRNLDTLIILTWDATGWAAYLDGATSPSAEAATAPNMDGAGSGFAMGSLEGGIANFLKGPVYAALAMNRRATAAEIATITRDFQRTYQ